MNMSKYHFVLIRDKRSTSSGTWYLTGDSLDVIMEHFKKYVGTEMKEGIKQMFARKTGTVGHYTNHFAGLIDMVSCIKEESCLQTAIELENELLRNRIKFFKKGIIQYFNTSLQTFLLSDSCEIVDEVYKDTLVFPHEEKPSINDIRFLQWSDGIHYYAKIGKIDIIDKNGNQKWDTKAEAEEAAKWYIESNY